MARVSLEYQGNELELPEGESVLGRDLGCRIRFNDAGVSRRHARVIVTTGTAVLEDLGSTNGTQVNGETIAGRRALIDGDKIEIGARGLRVRLTARGPSMDETQRRPRLSEAMMHDAVEHSEPTAVVAHSSLAFQGGPTYEAVVKRARDQRCPDCGALVRLDAEACPSCGHIWPSRPGTTTRANGVPAMQVPRDRRGFTRIPVAMPVLYMSESLTMESVGSDLSRGGMFVCTEILDPEGTECTLTVLPDGAPAVVLPGTVDRVVMTPGGRQLAGIGVRFGVLEPEVERWLWQTIRIARRQVP